MGTLARGLVGWWRLDGRLVDESGNGNNATVGAGSAAYAAGKFGQAWDNDATRFVDCGNAASLQITNNLTLAAWVRITAAPVVSAEIIEKFDTGGNQRGFAIGLDLNLKVVTRHSPDGTNNLYGVHRSTGSIALNQWHFVASTFTSGVCRIYINGVLDSTNTAPFAVIHNSTSPVRLGVLTINSTPSRHFPGQIDNAMIYNRALAPAEIRQLYALGSPIGLV